MPEPTPPSLTPRQASVLMDLVEAGFKLVRVPHVERYLAVEKDGFLALLDPADGKLKIFGQAGYRIGEGIGMLVERREGKAFVRKGRIVPATPELLAGYKKFKADLELRLRKRSGGS